MKPLKGFHAQQHGRINVNKLNRELRWFPVSARLLGFQKQEYIEDPAKPERIVV